MNSENQLVAVVTGAGSGIGAAIARELDRRNYRVVATDRDHSAAAKVADNFGGEALELDVTDHENCEFVAEHVAETHGSLDVWISNAGVSKMLPFLDITPEDLERTLDVNLKGVFFSGQAAARVMVSRKIRGTIINTASMAGQQGRVDYLADYVASKFGVIGLTQAMAKELAAHGITVNAVCPGYVKTSMQERELAWEAELRRITEDEVRTLYIADTPLGRLETPSDVARVVAFLASPDARFITGESIAVNGGAYMS